MRASTFKRSVPRSREPTPAQISLKTGGPVPLYHQIFLVLRNRIYGGLVGPDEKIPGEQEVCAEFGVSRITAKRALNELAEAGLVIRERGRGTRVVKRPPAPVISASIEGWLENVVHMGRSTKARVLDFRYIDADIEVANALEMETGSEVQRVERVRLIDGMPMSYLITYLPGSLGRQFGSQDLNEKPLLQLLEEAGVKVAAARQTISATAADGRMAKALDIQVGAPLIEVKRVVRDSDGKPVEYILAVYRPDLYRYEMSMRRIREKNGMRWKTQT